MGGVALASSDRNLASLGQLNADIAQGPNLINRAMSAFVKVFGCRPHDGGAAHTGGWRPQTSKGGNRGKGHVGSAAGVMGI